MGSVPRTLIVSLALTVLAGACTADGTVEIVPPVEANEPLPDLSGPSLDGGTIDIAEFEGAPMVVNAWASWCGPCEDEMPELIGLSREYADEGVRFLGINHGDQQAAARAFAARMGTPYPSVEDPAGRFAADLGYVGLPATFIVDAAGTIRWAVYGPTDAETLRPLIDDVVG
jgi:cytochrome c biogenesis protein CcmG/thiol:disulfide interchange protein DsbE